MCHVYIRGTLTLIWLAAAIFSGQGVTWIFSTNWATIFFTKARLRGKEDMRLTAANFFGSGSRWTIDRRGGSYSSRPRASSSFPRARFSIRDT